jgi:hypothetical protein
MMIPRVRLPRENLEAIIPPRIREEVASKPHKNAFNIIGFVWIKYGDDHGLILVIFDP